MFIGRVSFRLYTLKVSVLMKDFPSVFIPEKKKIVKAVTEVYKFSL